LGCYYSTTLLLHLNNSVVCFHYHLPFLRCLQRSQAQQHKFCTCEKLIFSLNKKMHSNRRIDICCVTCSLLCKKEQCYCCVTIVLCCPCTAHSRLSTVRVANLVFLKIKKARQNLAFFQSERLGSEKTTSELYIYYKYFLKRV